MIAGKIYVKVFCEYLYEELVLVVIIEIAIFKVFRPQNQ